MMGRPGTPLLSCAALPGPPEQPPKKNADAGPTPELPLLQEAASELACLDEVQPLPASVVDLKRSCLTPTTAFPASPQLEESGEEETNVEKTISEWLPRGATDAGEQPERREELATAPPPPPLAAMGPPLEAVALAGAVAQGYMAMWCRIDIVAEDSALITPFAVGSANGDEPPEGCERAPPGSVIKLCSTPMATSW